MKSRITTIIAMAALAASAATAQTAVDAYNITPTQLRGTARFVSMGGAFTSLGGDISSMTQNPAGLGLYRYSDIGLSFDISMRSNKTVSLSNTQSNSETKVKFDNFGYVGVANLNGALRSIQWGFSYNRLAAFDRISSGYVVPTATSLSNYIASYTQGYNSDYLLDSSDSSFNPYFDPIPGTNDYADWLSTLAYNSFMINNTTSNTEYAGLYQQGTTGDALFESRESGYIDEYNIDIAGNVNDVVYWGLGVGIVDMQYRNEANYSESMEQALVYNTRTDNLTAGNAAYNLYNHTYVSGSGANLKLGVIVRPTDDLRIGLAVHTPTWLHLTHSGYGIVDYNYSPYTNVDASRPTLSGSVDTPDYEYGSRLNTPWRIMAGVSYTVASKAIVSLDFERVAYNDMKLKEEGGGFMGSYVENTSANTQVKELFKASDIVRVGVEYLLSSSFSARAGFNWQGSAVRNAANDGSIEVSTSGLNPSYTFYGSTSNICLGLGYHYKNWYVDLAYQHTHRTGTYHAYTSFAGNAVTPSAKTTDNHNNIVISTGFRF